MLRTLYKEEDRFIETYWSKFGSEVYSVGDAARRDEDGYYWIIGRTDDVLNVSGHRMSTAEIESAIVSYDKVAEAAVIGQADEDSGQSVTAFVTLEGEHRRRRRDGRQDPRARRQEDRQARPAQAHHLGRRPPKTRSGKIMRRLLRDIAEGRELGDVTTLRDPTLCPSSRARSGASDRRGVAMPTSYEEAREQHSWDVPERYNIAADVCDKHPPDKLAMIHEHFDGTVREVHWGELQAASNRYANVLREHGVEQGDRVAMLLPPTPETAAAFFGTFKAGAILLSMSVLYGDDGIRHRVSAAAKFLITDARTPMHRPLDCRALLLLETCRRTATIASRRWRRSPKIPPTLLPSGTTAWPRGSCTRIAYLLAARGVHLLHDVPYGSCPRHGECAWSAGIARCSAVRHPPSLLCARGRLRTPSQLDVLSRHCATKSSRRRRDALDAGIADAGKRYPQNFRIGCSGRVAQRMRSAGSASSTA